MDYTSLTLSNTPADIDAPAIVDAEQPSRTLSFRKYASDLKRVAVGLKRLGVQDQQCVALLTANDPYYYVLGDGVVAAGAVFCGLSTPDKAGELATSLKVATVKWLFASKPLLPLALEAARIASIPDEHVVLFDPPGREEDHDETRHTFSQLLSDDESQWQPPLQDRDPSHVIAFRMMTSGTTGSPKAVNLAHSRAIARLGSRRPQGKRLHCFGAYHLSAQVCFRWALRGDEQLFLSASTSALDIVDNIAKHKASRCTVVPRHMDEIVTLIDSGTRHKSALESLSGLMIIGSVPQQSTLQRIASVLPDNAYFGSIYGLTECGGISYTAKGKGVPWPYGDVGPPIANCQVKVLPLNGEETLGPHSEGEVCVRNAYTFDHYHDDPDATKAAFVQLEDGAWFRTGDVGRLCDSTGHLILSGRIKEVFRAEETSVIPGEVERAIAELPCVADVAVWHTASRASEDDLEAIAYVVRKRGAQSASAQKVVDHVAGLLSRQKVPTGGVVFVESIPRNALGKIKRRALEMLLPLEGSERFLVPSQGSCLGF